MSRAALTDVRAERSRSSAPARLGLLERERAKRADDGRARDGEEAALEHCFGRLKVTETPAPVIQPKLRMGTPGDKYEREADQVANQVMQLPDRQRPHRSGHAGESGNAGAVRGSRGAPLDTAVREFMEWRFGHPFGDVRVHTDGQAAASAEALGAKAYTLGRDIVFGAGEYSPGTLASRRLLAHELTHVVQQSPAKEDAGQTRINRVGAPLIQRALSDEDAVRDFRFTVIPFAEVERAQRFVEQKLRGVPASDGVQRIRELKDLVFLHELREYLATLRPSTPQQIDKLQTLLNATATRIGELKGDKERQARREQRRERAVRRRKKAEAESLIPEGMSAVQVRSFSEAVSRLEFARDQATKDTPDYTVAAEAVEQVLTWIESVRNEENLRVHFPRSSTRDRVAGILWNTHAIDSVLLRMRIGAPAKGLWEPAFESLRTAGPFLRELSGDTAESDRETVAAVEYATSAEAGWLTLGGFAAATSIALAAGALVTLAAEYGLASGLVGRLGGAITERPEFWYGVFEVALGTGIVVVAAGPEEFVESVATPEGAAQTAYQVVELILLRKTSVPRSPGTRSQGKKAGVSQKPESSREPESTAKRLDSTSPEGTGASLDSPQIEPAGAERRGLVPAPERAGGAQGKGSDVIQTGKEVRETSTGLGQAKEPQRAASRKMSAVPQKNLAIAEGGKITVQGEQLVWQHKYISYAKHGVEKRIRELIKAFERSVQNRSRWKSARKNWNETHKGAVGFDLPESARDPSIVIELDIGMAGPKPAGWPAVEQRLRSYFAERKGKGIPANARLEFWWDETLQTADEMLR